MAVIPFGAQAVSILDEWIQYCSKRGLTLKDLVPPGQLLDRENAGKFIGKHVHAFGVIGAFVFPASGKADCPHLNSRLIYPPAPSIPKVGSELKALKRPKYLGQEGSPNYLFVPPSLTDWTTDHDLYIVEGPLVAQRLSESSIPAVGLNGVWNFRVGKKMSPIMPDLKTMAQGSAARTITIFGDSDVMDRPDLQGALNTLMLELTKLRPDRIDTLYTCFPPSADNGEKLGPDDYLQLIGREEFIRFVREQRRKWDDHPYLQIERKWVERVIFDEHSGNYYDCKIRKEVPREHINMNMAPGSRVLDLQSSKGKIISYKTDQYLISPAARIAQGMRFQPDEPNEFFLHADGSHYINKARPDDFPTPIKGDVSIFMEMLASVCRDSPSAKQKILVVAARHAQLPAFSPIKHAILLTGEQRAGKSTLARCIGLALSKRYSTARVDLTDKFNSHWRGYACREWAELDKHMDGEWLKDLITSTTYTVREMRVNPYDENNYTLNIFTANGLQSKLQEGDERFIVAGYAKRDNQRLGLEFERWVDGPGPQYLRHHLLYEVDCSPYETMGAWTEMQEAVLDASKDYRMSVKDEIMYQIESIPGLECIPNVILSDLLEPHKVNTISFIKSNAQHFVKPKLEIVKIDGTVYRFRAALNHDRWAKEEDAEAYRKQFELAQRLLSRKKF